MKGIKANYHDLHVLKKSKPKLKKAIISSSDKKLVNNINECVLKVLNCNIPPSSSLKRRLRKHKATLRQLADKRVRHSAKKRLLVQRGFFCCRCYLHFSRS